MPPRWAELRLKEIVQGLDPSGIPWCQAIPNLVQEAFPSGADSCRPEEPAVMVAVVLPAVALAVTLVGHRLHPKTVTATATDGNSGTLPAITTTSTINLPVAEVQTLTTNHNNPRQN